MLNICTCWDGWNLQCDPQCIPCQYPQGEIRGQFIVPKASKAIGTFLAAAASHQSFNFTYKGKPVDVVLETSASSPPAVSAQIIVNNKKKYLTAAQIQEVGGDLDPGGTRGSRSRKKYNLTAAQIQEVGGEGHGGRGIYPYRGPTALRSRR